LYERLARAALWRLLARHPEIEVVGEARDIAEAQEATSRFTPDVLFLDIEMPGGNGFDLLERLEDVPLVVFCTAYDTHALRAFEVNALDYRVKPVQPGEALCAEVTKLRITLSKSGS
jgi:two-component system LytT family response regulator